MTPQAVREAIAAIERLREAEWERHDLALDRLCDKRLAVQAKCEHQTVHHGSDANGKRIRVCRDCGKDVT